MGDSTRRQRCFVGDIVSAAVVSVAFLTASAQPGHHARRSEAESEVLAWPPAALAEAVASAEIPAVAGLAAEAAAAVPSGAGRIHARIQTAPPLWSGPPLLSLHYPQPIPVGVPEREAKGEDEGVRSGPKILPQWCAEMEGYASLLFGMRMTGHKGILCYDHLGRRHRIRHTATTSYFRPNATMDQDMTMVARPDGIAVSNATIGFGVDGVCAPWFGDGAPFVDLFEWLQHAKPEGERIIQGERCVIYRLVIPSQFFNYSACLTADGLPREFNHTWGGRGALKIWEWMRFKRFTIGDPGDDAFSPTPGCALFPRKPCKDEGILTLDVYRIFGAHEPLDLANRDVGDIFGDLAFICTQGLEMDYKGKYIAHWRVNVSRRFGQYSMCNFNGTDNVCDGPPAQLRTVGRRSGQSQGIGPSMGQCSPNDDVGSQYSFPREARCPPGTLPDPAAEGCAWSGAEVLRIISATCLTEDRGLLKMCEAEIGHAPFKRSAVVWEAAFASDDPAKGGCPQVHPSGAVDGRVGRRHGEGLVLLV